MIACDLGSNTLRIVQLDCETKKRIKEYEKTVKTADGLQKTGEINKNTINRIIQALEEAKKCIDFSSDEVVAVTTAALRLASNSDKVINKIKKETGVEFKIISGTQEADWTALAVSEALKRISLEYKDFILLDLGGGSSELYIKKDDRAFIKSFNIGIVTITQKYNSFEEVKNSLENETDEIKKFIEELYKTFKKPKIFVSTAGTATTLAAFKKGIDYKHYSHDQITGTKLNTKEIKEFLQKLLSMDEENRNKWIGVGRSDLIFSGIAILLHILKLANFDEMIVIDDGLREGLAIASCNDNSKLSSIINTTKL